MEDMKPRLYSLNLITYVWYATGIEPDVYQDEECNYKYYCTFKQCVEVATVIDVYKHTNVVVDIKRYLHYYKMLRNKINALRLED